MSNNTIIQENLNRVRDSISSAALKCGRKPEDITCVAVSKTRPASDLDAAIEAGVVHLGENRVQEVEGKKPDVSGSAVWHLIGHLQSNKAKIAVELFNWIDSVDSLKLARKLSGRAEELEKRITVLAQVNISGEGVKSGVDPDKVVDLVSEMKSMPFIDLKGLMTIGSFGVGADRTRDEFARMKQLFDSVNEETGLGLDVLSMGMSGDYTIAIEEGATMVRVGTAIFGERR